MGHSRPEMNIPFLSTREMFLLKMGPPGEAQEYIDATPAERRRILDGKLSKKDLPNLKEITGWAKPRFISDLEWYALPLEVGRAMATLRAMSEHSKLTPLQHLLSINPGAPFDKSTWTFVGFKGGSEPGVLNLTWLLRRSDDRWFTLTVGLNDEENPIDTFEVANLMVAASTFISK